MGSENQISLPIGLEGRGRSRPPRTRRETGEIGGNHPVGVMLRRGSGGEMPQARAVAGRGGEAAT